MLAFRQMKLWVVFYRTYSDMLVRREITAPDKESATTQALQYSDIYALISVEEMRETDVNDG